MEIFVLIEVRFFVLSLLVDLFTLLLGFHVVKVPRHETFLELEVWECLLGWNESDLLAQFLEHSRHYRLVLNHIEGAC